VREVQQARERVRSRGEMGVGVHASAAATHARRDAPDKSLRSYPKTLPLTPLNPTKLTRDIMPLAKALGPTPKP